MIININKETKQVFLVVNKKYLQKVDIINESRDRLIKISYNTFIKVRYLKKTINPDFVNVLVEDIVELKDENIYILAEEMKLTEKQLNFLQSAINQSKMVK